MKLLKRVSIIVIIFLKINVKSLNNLLESTLIEFSLSLVNIFTMPSQIRNEVRRVIKTLIIEEYFFLSEQYLRWIAIKTITQKERDA